MASPLKVATRSVKDHPFIVKLNRSVRLEDDDLAALAPLLGRTLAVKKGKDIIVEGNKYKAIHVIENGFAVRYKVLHGGKRQIVGIALPGDIIGFPACFFEYAVLSVMSIAKMSVHQIPLETFAALCLKRANIATALVWFAAREAAIYAEHIIDTGRREPLERLAHFLLEIHTRLFAIGHASENSFDMLMSQESIGDVVGLSAPHVNRMLRELRTEGLISVSGREVRILDMAALQILGEFRSSYLAHTPVFDPKQERSLLRKSG